MSDDYDRKLRDMQKYVPFLENLIQNLKKNNKHDEKREAQLNKMQMFYELLTNKNKKLKLETLERCEQVLVRLHERAEKIKSEMPLVKASTSTISIFQAAPAAANQVDLKTVATPSSSKLDEQAPVSKVLPSNEAKSSEECLNDNESSEKSVINDPPAIGQEQPTEIAETQITTKEDKVWDSHEESVREHVEEKDSETSVASQDVQEEQQTGTEEPVSSEPEGMPPPEEIVPSQVDDDCRSENSKEPDVPSENTVQETPPEEEEEMQSSDVEPSEETPEKQAVIDEEQEPPHEDDKEMESSDVEASEEIPEKPAIIDEEQEAPPEEEEMKSSDIEASGEIPEQPAVIDEETSEPQPACSSMEVGEDDFTTENSPGNIDSKQATSKNIQPAEVSSSTMKNDPEDCSVSSTTVIEPRHDKPIGDESDEQNSLQDTVTDSSSNTEDTKKEWLQGNLLNFLSPQKLDKSTVLEMLGKVVDDSKLEKIKAILGGEENPGVSPSEEKPAQPEEDKKETVAECDENKVSAIVPEQSSTALPVVERKGMTTRHRRSEIDRLNADIRFMLQSEPKTSPANKRATAEIKVPVTDDVAPPASKPVPKKTVTVTPASDAPPKKKKKKKHEVFSYRTRRRSRRKKPKPKAVAQLQAAETESVADGTESSLGGDESIADEVAKGDEELGVEELEDAGNGEEVAVAATNGQMTEEQMAEAERNFKNIHPEMHALSKYQSTCAICNFSGRYVTTHYINSHRMTEMVVSRLPPPVQARLMRGEGVQSKFAGKDAFQNRMYFHSCPFCNIKKNFSRKIWSQHFGSHTGEYKYKCSGCGYMSVNVRGHILKYCPGARPIMLENLDRGLDIVGFICKLCNFIQMNREHIATHLETQHELKDGTDELIIEITLFRSDPTGFVHAGRKPQKAIAPAKTQPLASKSKIIRASKIKPITKPSMTAKSTPPAPTKSTPVAKLMSTLPKQRPTTPVAGPSSQLSKKVKPVVEEAPPSEVEDELLEEISPPSDVPTGGEIVIPKSIDGKPIKNIYPYMHSQSEYVNRCVLCNFSGKFITKHYVKEHPNAEVFVSRIPPDRQACLVANKPLAKLGPMTVVKYKSYFRHAACPFCKVEKSSQRFDWVMHYTIHTGEYKFRCSECYYHGNARNEFSRHYKQGCPKGKLIRLWSTYKYNEEDPIFAYFCNICNFLQMSRNNVERHLKTQHGSSPDNLTRVTLFTGNPRYKGRRTLGSGKKSKRLIRKITHQTEGGELNVPDFLCDGGFVDEEFMADDSRQFIDNDDEEQSPKTSARLKAKAANEDDDLVLPMHQLSQDFTNSGFEDFLQIEMDVAEGENNVAESEATAAPEQEDEEFIRPTDDPLMNIHSEMHALSVYASKCLLCNFVGKYIAKHYVEEHTDHEVFSSRLPPDGQRRLLTGEACMPIEAVVRCRKFNYYFSCPFCNLERFCTRHNWIAHFVIHTGEYKYQCSHCSHRGNTSRDFKNHFKGKCRLGQQIRMWPDLVSKEEPIVAYFCNLCNFIQLERSRVIQHLNTQHSCYEQLVSKVTLMFIDPNASVTKAPTTLPASLQQKMMSRKGGRPRVKPWPSTREEAAAAEEEDDEDNVSNESENEDNEKSCDLEDNGQNDVDDEDVIEIDDSDEDDQIPRRQPANTSSTSGYEKIRQFLERTEKSSLKVTSVPRARLSDKNSDSVAPLALPPKEQPLSNVYPEMHSKSSYAKKCILCTFTGRHLINHYVSVHPRFEVPISRLPPESQERLFRGENNTAIEIESNPYSPKLFSYNCLFCETKFTFAIKSWVDHIGTHTGEYNFKCSECGRMINSKHDIQDHIKNFCKKGRALARQFPVTEKQVLLAYICKECNFIQMNHGNVVQHLRGQHKVSNPDASIQQIVLIRFGKTPLGSKAGLRPQLDMKRDDRIRVQNTHGDTRYTSKGYVQVEQSSALCELLVPKTNLCDMPSTSGRDEIQEPEEQGTVTHTSSQGGVYTVAPGLRATKPQALARRSAPPAPQLVTPSRPVQMNVIKQISNLGYSQTADGTKYHCCIRSCSFTPTTVPITLATHIMDEHGSLIWEGYCRECQGHVATGKNMKLTKEIQHLFEHTRKRPAEGTETQGAAKMARHSMESAPRSGSPSTDSATQIIARFAKNKSITITRESKPPLAPGMPATIQAAQSIASASDKQREVMKEAKQTTLKPWTVSKSFKSATIVKSMLGDLSLFGFFKCMGNNCMFTTNDSNKMAEHMSYHTDPNASDTNVASWLECCYCSTWAGSAMQLIAHVTAKHSRDIYQCPYCFYRSCEESNVLVHLKHYHTKERIRILHCFGRKVMKPNGDACLQALKRSSCSGCSCLLVNPIAFATNIAECTDTDLGGDIYKCYYCLRKHTKSLTEFTRHIVEHRPIRKADTYQCLRCFKAQMNIPLVTNKPTIRTFQCVHCAFSTDEDIQMSLHMAQVHASNLLFCGIRIRTFNNTPNNDNLTNRLDNGAAFVLLKTNVDPRVFYKCPFTPTQLNYHDPKLTTETNSSTQNDEDVEMNRDASGHSSAVAPSSMGLQIATVQSITSTEFESFITIDDDDDD